MSSRHNKPPWPRKPQRRTKRGGFLLHKSTHRVNQKIASRIPRSLCPDPFLYLRAPYVDAVVCTSAPLQKVDFWRQLRRFYVCRIQIHIFGIAPVAGRSWLRHLFGRSSGAQLRSGDPSGPAPSLASLLPQGEALDHHRSHRSGARGALDSCIFVRSQNVILAPQLRLVRTAAIWRRRRRRQRSPQRVFQSATARALEMVLILLFRSGSLNLNAEGPKQNPTR